MIACRITKAEHDWMAWQLVLEIKKISRFLNRRY